MELTSLKYLSENSIESCCNSESYFDDQENLSISDMLKIFISSGDEKKEIIPVTMPASSNLFIVRDVTNDTTLLKNKKRGRHTNLKEKKREHNKFSADNIQRKIQVHYQSFILNWINDILESCGNKEKFKNISYENKKKVNKSQFNKLKNSTIGDIISQQISDKYKKVDKDYNSNLYKYLKTYKFLEKIFNINYLAFFRMFYMKNEKIVDLKIFGIEKVITLSDKTETYYDNLENLKKEEDEKYIKEFEKCLKNNYLMEKFALYRDFSIQF